MKKSLNVIGTFALVLALFTMAFASVTLNEDGTGFVGKGDVQAAFGWNNAALQANAAGVTFTLNATDNYLVECTWVTGLNNPNGPRTHTVEHNKTANVSASVGFDSRKNKQGDVTGFTLTGFTGDDESGAVPVLNGPCPGTAGTGAYISEVTFLNSTGGLYANFGGESILLSQE